MGWRSVTRISTITTRCVLELSTPQAAPGDRYKRITTDPAALDRLLVDLFLESYDQAPREIWLDLDAKDDPLHGHQEERFLDGYYRCYCYLPLFIFRGEHLLCARLRPSNADGAAGSVAELERIVAQIRARWPKTWIVVTNLPESRAGTQRLCEKLYCVRGEMENRIKVLRVDMMLPFDVPGDKEGVSEERPVCQLDRPESRQEIFPENFLTKNPLAA